MQVMIREHPRYDKPFMISSPPPPAINPETDKYNIGWLMEVLEAKLERHILFCFAKFLNAYLL
jgi:hypothetical protein